MAISLMPEISYKFVGQPDDMNTVLDPDEIKAKLDLLPEEVRVKLNAVIAILNSVAAGTSGADNIGITETVAGSGVNVRTRADWLYQQIVNTALGLITDRSLTAIKIAFGTITTAELAFDPATQVELDAHLADDVKHAPDAIGTVGQLLSVNQEATGTEWKTVSLSDGAWEKIAEQTLATAVTQVDFASIPAGYTHLKILFNGKSSGALTSTLIRFNDDSGNYYYSSYIRQIATTISGATSAASSSILLNNTLSNAAGGGIDTALCEITISNRAAYSKVLHARTYEPGIPTSEVVGAKWISNVGEINKISFIAGADQIGIGSKFILWGVK